MFICFFSPTRSAAELSLSVRRIGLLRSSAMSRTNNISGLESGDKSTEARKWVVSLVLNDEGLNAGRSVSKIPGDRTLLFRKTFIVTLQVKKNTSE